MKKYIKAIALIMSAVLVFIAFSSCGAGQSGEKETSRVSQNENETTEPSGTLADGILTVGTCLDYPPFAYTDESGNPAGFDIALISLIGQKLGVDVVVENMEFGELIPSVGKTVDVAIAALNATDEREKEVDFSENYYSLTKSIIVASGDKKIKSASDLSSARVGVREGTTSESTANNLSSKVVPFKNTDKAVAALLEGKVDAVITDSSPAQSVIEKNAGKLKAVEDSSFDREYLSIALPEGDAALNAAVSTALDTIRRSGEFDSIIEQYLLI